MNKLFKSLIVCVVVAGALTCNAYPANAGEGGPRIVIPSMLAKVAGEPITLSELKVTLLLLEDTQAVNVLTAPNKITPDVRMRLARAVGLLIERRVLLHIAWRKVDKLEGLLSRILTEAIKLPSRPSRLVSYGRSEVMKPLTDNYIEAQDKRFGNRASFEAELKKYDLTMAQVRTKYLEDVMIQIYLNYLAGVQDYVSPEDVRQYFKDNPDKFRGKWHYSLRRIFISGKSRESDKALEIAAAAYQRLEKGEKFEDVAKALSESKDAKDGGKFLYIEDDEVVQGIKEVAGTLGIGNYSKIITSIDGYYIVQLEKKEQKDPVRFEDAVARIKKEIMTARRAKKFTDQVFEARKELEILNYFRKFLLGK